jgi:hypothetical protein
VRRLFAVAALVVGLLVVPSAAQGAFSGSVNAPGTTATLTGDGGDDYLVVDQSGGFLRHNDLGGTFNGPVDWDSTQVGDQKLANDGLHYLTVNGMGGNDGFVIGTASVPASSLLPYFTLDGGTEINSLQVVDLSDATGRNVTIGPGSVGGLSGPLTYMGMASLTVVNGTGSDTVTVSGTSAATSVFSGDGDDTVSLANGLNLNGGVLNGGAGANTLDYSGWSSPFTVDLGNTVEAYAAVLASLFESSSTSDAFGVAQVDFTPGSPSALAFSGSVAGITPFAGGGGGARELLGSHIHKAPPGVDGGIIFDLDHTQWTGSIPSLTRSFSGATTFPSTNVPDLRAGNTYVNLHTGAFPGGAIRGQLLRTGFAGTATGTARIAGFGVLKTPTGTVTPTPPPTGGGTGGGGGGTESGPATAPPLLPVAPPVAEDPARGVTLSGAATVAPNGAAVIGTITNPPTASASASLSGILPARFAVAAAKKRKPKPVTVATGQATAAAGATQRLTVKLSAKARKALKRKASIKATATVTARGTNGATTQVRKPITLRRGKAKSKR